jgi:hypothetical protein
MKTVADFKRALKPGVILHTISHRESKRDEQGNVIRAEDGLPVFTDRDMGNTTVSIVQSTQFAVKRTRTDGTTQDSWCAYPKASQVKIEGNSITILEDCRERGMQPILTYTIVEAN